MSKQPTQPSVPELLARRVQTEGGDAGRAWLEELPDLIHKVSRRWSLTLEPPRHDHDGVSWVAHATTSGGTRAVLKVGLPHREASYEAAGLRFYDGVGAVRLLDADEERFTLLLERCEPGHDLWTLPLDEGNAVAAEVLRELWRPAPESAGFERLDELVAEWCAEFPTKRPDYPPELVALASEEGKRLAGSMPSEVLVHGDFHPFNVLAATREPWLAIDCKPLIGDPAYDLAQYLANRVPDARTDHATVREIGRQIDFFADRLALDPRRIAGWAFVKSLGWTWGPTTARLFAELAGLV